MIKYFFLLFPILISSQKKFDSLRKVFKNKYKYEYVYEFKNNFAVFRTFNEKMGIIDSAENVIIKPVFSYINNENSLKNLFEVGNYDKDKKIKRGFIDLKGNIRIPIIYDNIFYEGKGIISVNKNSKFGIIDTLNNVVLPIVYDNILIDNNLLIANINNNKYLFDLKGNRICNLQFSNISTFKDNKAIITFFDKTNAIINNQGTIILKPIKGFDYIKILDNDLFLVKDKISLKEGVININEEFQITCKYDELKQVKSYFIAKSKTKKGFISPYDSLVKPFIYDEIYFNNLDEPVVIGENNIDNNYVVIKSDLYGVINPNIKNDVIPIQYKNIRVLFDSYYIVENSENKKGLFFKSGKKILNEEYEFYNTFKNCVFASKNNIPFLIYLENENFRETEVLVDSFVNFNEIISYNLNHPFQIFKRNEKYGVINYENDIVIPSEYDTIENIYHTKQFIVKKDDKYGIVNSKNNILIEIEYDSFKKMKEVILFSKKNKSIKKYHQISFIE